VIVYRATNKLTGKMYVGLTRRLLKQRIACHRLSSLYFGRALRKYGLEAFEFVVIDTARTEKTLGRKERYWIKHYDCIHPNGYNLTDGGEGGYKRLASSNKKIGEARKRYWADPANKQKASARLKGHEISQETRQKIAATLTGRKLPQKTKQKISATCSQHTPEWFIEHKEALCRKGINKGRPRPDLAINARKWAKSPDYINSMQGRKRPDLAARNRTKAQRQCVSNYFKNKAA
jgi:group I intron endonuclease